MEPPRPHPRIAALRSEENPAIQELLDNFASELAQGGWRVAGVTQARRRDAATGRERIVLREPASGALYQISQDLGPGSAACNLDTRELARACAAIEGALASGVDLVVISKFSKQEAARGGLIDAFRAAITAKVPVVTAVSPHYRDEWREFAGPLAEFVRADHAALEDWWERVQASGRSEG
ncbi:MAG: DUF2478 domain-containing protein [Methylocystis sp.]|nr:DUF2478 domain-containing protein [Methylocystis sp.]MBI3274691.1 DUF2478 domain-containing protein [Methylocystis sp.]